MLPIDTLVADHAATIGAKLGARKRQAIRDVLIAATARAAGLPLVTRNRRDFKPRIALDGAPVELLDWTK